MKPLLGKFTSFAFASVCGMHSALVLIFMLYTGAHALALNNPDNNNSSVTHFRRVLDTEAPTVTITSTIPDPTNITQIPLSIVFSEEVTGFDLSDLTVSTGTISNFQTTDNIHWTATFTLGFGGNFITIAAGAAQDLAGNNSTNGHFQRTFENISPTVTLSSESTNPTKDKPIVVKIKFDELVLHFDINDIKVVNGTASNLQPSDYYFEEGTVDIYPTADGPVTVDIPAGAVTDFAQNNNIAATQFSRTYDGTSPTVAISSTTTAHTNSNPIPVSIQFSEAVTGFDESDIVVTNGTIVSFGGGGVSYTMEVVPSGEGAVTVDIAAGVAQDAVGNYNTAATQFTRIYDSQAPSVTISSSVPDPTNLISMPINIDFSEEVTGFTLSDITVNSATISNLETTDHIHWTALVTFTTRGGKWVEIAAGVAQDLAGNDNTEAPYLQRTYDPNPPTVILSSTSTNPTRDNPFVLKLSFSETVINFDVSDLIVTNGTAKNLQTEYFQKEWTVDIYPTASGIVTVNLPTGAVQDQADNNNIAATQFSCTYDITPPSIVISSTSTHATHSNPFPVTITFSEEVSGFDLPDISVTNGTLSGLATTDNITWTANITPATSGAVLLNIPADVAQDVVGNNNTAVEYTVMYDPQAPSVVISSANEFISEAPKAITFTFDEPVTGFDIGDIAVTNGTVSNFSGSGSSYTAYVAGAGEGTVSIAVNAAVAQDAAGNDNLSATTLALTFVYAPYITRVKPNERCGAGSVILEANTTKGTINWYSSAEGGESLGTGTSFTTPEISGTTSFYVDAVISGISSLTRTEVTATIKPIPTITATTAASRCGMGSVALQATASAGTINWFDAVSGGNSVGSGTSINTPDITNTTIYYVEAANNGCVSQTRTAVTATINNYPDMPSDITGNAGPTNGTKEPYSITNVPGVTYQWVATNGTVTGTGNSVEITWNAQGNQTITVTPSNSCGAGTSRTQNITVKASSVGINDEPAVAAYKTYPNPATDFIYIENPSGEDGSVMIYSLTNQLVLEKPIRSKLEKIDISSLNVGVYTIIITNKDGEKRVQKLVRM